MSATRGQGPVTGKSEARTRHKDTPSPSKVQSRTRGRVARPDRDGHVALHRLYSEDLTCHPLALSTLAPAHHPPRHHHGIHAAVKKRRHLGSSYLLVP